MEESNNQGAGAPEGVEGSEAQQPDPIKNLKSEFGRKFDSVQDQLKAQNEQLQRMVEQIIAAQSAKQEPQEEPDPVLNPKQFKEQIKREALAEVQRSTQLSMATQNEVARIQAMYPEFAQENSEAAQIALKKFQALPAHLKGTPEGARLVLFEAANEVGLVPKKARKTEQGADEGYTMGSSPSKNIRQSSQGKLDERSLAFAQLVGLNVDDPEVRKRLENRTKRAFNKYE